MADSLAGLCVRVGFDVPDAVSEALLAAGAFIPEEDSKGVDPDVLVTNDRDAALSSPNVAWVHSTWQGVDRLVGGGWPDGVRLTRTIGGIPARIADYVSAVHVAQQFGLPQYARRQQALQWRQDLDGCEASRVRECVVVGTGPIGVAVARRMHARGYACLGLNSSGRNRPGPFANVKQLDAFDGQSQAGLIVLALPLNASTRALIGAQFLRRFRSAHLVNVGRAQTLVSLDLVRALDEGTIGVATIDVLACEPAANEDPLWTHPRVFVTPHIAGRTYPQDVVDSLALARTGILTDADVSGANLVA